MRITRLTEIAVKFFFTAVPSVALASAPTNDSNLEPEAPFTVSCDQNDNGAGGYLVRVQSHSRASIKIFDLLINDRLECSTVQVIKSAGAGDIENQAIWTLRNADALHTMWFHSGKAIIDSDAMGMPSSRERALSYGKPLLWQTACAPSDVKMTTSAGYAEFKFGAILPPNPGRYFGTQAYKTPKLMTPQHSFGW